MLGWEEFGYMLGFAWINYGLGLERYKQDKTPSPNLVCRLKQSTLTMQINIKIGLTT